MSVLHYRPQYAYELVKKEYLSDITGNFFHLLCVHRNLEIRQIMKALLTKIMIIIKTELYTNFMVPIPQN